MLLWEKEIPKYLTDRKNVVGFILFTAIFALTFINIYSPFGSDKWLNVTQFQFFFYSSIVILIGMLVVVFSRLLLYLVKRKRPIKFGEYAIWVFGEIFFMALVYSIIQRFFLQVNNDFMIILRNSMKNTALVILLPYIISWLYLSFRDKYKTLEDLTRRRTGFPEMPAPENKILSGFSMLSFKDEKGVLKFSIKKEDLLYLEAADNYIIIHYLDQQQLKKYIVRTTLKRIETEFAHSYLVRCHRSYMVNMDKVKMIRKEKEGLIVGFEAPVNIIIPISKTYFDVFIRKLSFSTAPDETEINTPMN